MESQQPQAHATIPQGISFEDLELRVEPGLGQVMFETEVLQAVAQRNNIEWSWLLQNEDRLTSLLLGWYHAHKDAGGAMNLAAEQIEIYLVAIEGRDKHSVHLGTSTIQ